MSRRPSYVDIFNRTIPRGIVILSDFGFVIVSLIAAFLIRFNFSIPETELETFRWVFPLVAGVRVVFFYLFKTHTGIFRYTSTRDIQRVLSSVLAGSLSLCLINVITYAGGDFYAVPFSILIIEFLLTFFLMSSVRAMIKILYLESMNPTREKTNVVIFGAGEAGVITKRTLDRDAGTRYRVCAFVDDNDKKAGKQVEGVTIYFAETHLEQLLIEFKVQHLIMAIQNLSARRKQELIEVCLRHHVKILNVPPVAGWINGTLSYKQIKKVKIEDLLGRETIRLDVKSIGSQLAGKRVLITGAAGSIGSELVRQVLKFNPEQVIGVDAAESPMYELETELNESRQLKNVITIIGDIRNKSRMQGIFRKYRPQIVYHAAAYKHVPVMENNPGEALLTNVLGTKVVARLAHESGVERFVMISTDKAVNPSSIMGATKRIAEIFIQAFNNRSETKFITTRFGNVLGSTGSVIPTFHKLIEERKPITITHPEITRFFMTIPEAVQLVLEAGAMGNGGEIYMFDMGRSVKIIDLAKKMVQLSGLELGKDIQLVFTGLRPGEKLYEELLADEENTIPTHHEKILIAKVREYEFDGVNAKVNELLSLFEKQDNLSIVSAMKEMVPEFRSRNSIYEELDNETVL